ncbi:hypothetical protein K2173_025271 [Erythroxylum novogranatense]|uniref:Receptor-like serine/threonine-protein kinase n=1 Tax=Erythroxylum novogranatense TaxID=1862640 RepID=A0AAV8UDG6_9ROSI|nr:hypothetical protein K2173_025271 [Erythroxylum novogranatense]
MVVLLLLSFLLVTSNADFSRFPTSRNHSNRLLADSGIESEDLLVNYGEGTRNEELRTRNAVIVRGNTTICSKNRTFELGFFNPDEMSKWYLGVRYASIPVPTCVWVANRETPIVNISSAALEITEEGRLVIFESTTTIWQTTNTEKAAEFAFHDTGNIVLMSVTGSVLWQSFDFPTDTWLPGMNITSSQFLTSWKSLSDPSVGLYSLRLNPREYDEFQLVYNKTFVYWNTGNWTGAAFSGVPEMTIQYIYDFHFADPYRETASFWYTETALDSALRPPLTRFKLDVNGQLKQYTWSQQTENWNMFWSEPENQCKVYGLCGNMAVCNKSLLKPCVCLPGYSPVDDYEWEAEGYSDGCSRGTDDSCGETDEFKEVGVFGFEGVVMESLVGSSKSVCERSCLSNCSCIGLIHDEKSNLCKTIYGSLFNLRNLSLDSTFRDVLYVRVPKEENVGKDKSRSVIWFVICSILGCVGFLVLVVGMVLLFCKRRRKGNEEDGAFPVLNLRAFSYKELYAATRGFSDKLGHGGFGAVFQGVLLDSTLVAVKRLERPGGAEKEFRAEVCTIGNIQHVNLVRLRGFCSENCHRLLVYDYMPNGPLSMYLRRDGPNLSWDVRFRIAIGTARGIAYLHEGCRDCIIHCDIKPENILLDTDYVAKVSDFGLAKLICRDFSRALVTMRGTWGYVAPEWISGVAITSKADVYSYGMTLLELLGGRRNVGALPSGSGGGVNHQRDGENEEKWFFPPYAAQEILQGNIAAVVDSKLGNAYKIEEAERIALVAIWCIQDTEDVRPTMATVVKMLEGIVETPIPPAPKLLQALISGESYRGIQMQSENGNTVSITGNNDRVSICGSQSSPGIEFSPANENVNHRMV